MASAQRFPTVQHSEPSSKVAFEVKHLAIRSALKDSVAFVMFGGSKPVAVIDGELVAEYAKENDALGLLVADADELALLLELALGDCDTLSARHISKNKKRRVGGR